MILSDNPAYASAASVALIEDVKNLGWNRIKKVGQRFYGTDLFKGIIESLKVPAA
jgi:hypothetical protein